MPKKPTAEDILDLSHDATASESPPAVPTWLTPRPKLADLKPSSMAAAHTIYSLFGYWFANYLWKDSAAGYWTDLYEYAGTRWRYLTRQHGETVSESDKKARAYARTILIEGQRPDATEDSPELAKLVAYWQEFGSHLLARDRDA